MSLLNQLRSFNLNAVHQYQFCVAIETSVEDVIRAVPQYKAEQHRESVQLSAAARVFLGVVLVGGVLVVDPNSLLELTMFLPFLTRVKLRAKAAVAFVKENGTEFLAGSLILLGLSCIFYIIYRYGFISFLPWLSSPKDKPEEASPIVGDDVPPPSPKPPTEQPAPAADVPSAQEEGFHDSSSSSSDDSSAPHVSEERKAENIHTMSTASESSGSSREDIVLNEQIAQLNKMQDPRKKLTIVPNHMEPPSSMLSPGPT